MTAFFTCALLFGALAPKISGKTIPSEANFVRNEVARGKNLLAENDIGKVLNDPYLVSALYYSDSFRTKIRTRKDIRDPQDDVMLGLMNFVTSAARRKYIAELRSLANGPSDKNMVLPLDHYKQIVKNCRSCHPDAVDLFTEEGFPVKTMSSGIVVLVEGTWQPNNPLATTSPRGGNEVIIFDPVQQRFYRYCHLGSVTVKVRDAVRVGQTIGTVGHTGLNASLPGHGKHLHLEINQYDPRTGKDRSLMRPQLIHELERVRNK